MWWAGQPVAGAWPRAALGRVEHATATRDEGCAPVLLRDPRSGCQLGELGRRGEPGGAVVTARRVPPAGRWRPLDVCYTSVNASPVGGAQMRLPSALKEPLAWKP